MYVCFLFGKKKLFKKVHVNNTYNAMYVFLESKNTLHIRIV